jgi:thiopeptide-type bacteriocin biosynthesis protein
MKPKQLYLPMNGILVRTPLLSTACDTEDNNNRAKSEMETKLAAIAVGSSSLFKRIQSAQACEKPSDTAEAFRKYEKRMCRRATPYGMFAGVSWGRFCSVTNLRRNPNRITTSTRPDMSWLLSLVSKLDKNKIVRAENLVVYPNPQLLLNGDRLWLHRNSTANHSATTQIKAIKSVKRALELSSGGIKFDLLCSCLRSEFGVSQERSEELCHRLCDLNILITELLFPPADWLQLCDKQLVLRDGSRNEMQKFKQALADIREWDETETKSGEHYLTLLESVQELAPPDTKNLLQVDSAFALDQNGVSHLVADELANVAEVILRLSTFPRYDSEISDYRNRFKERYQADREVPLLELLSPMFGLGSPYTGLSGSQVNLSHKLRDAKLIELATTALRTNHLQVELSEEDVTSMQLWKVDIVDAPKSLELFASICADSRDDIDRGCFELVISPRTGDIGAGRSIGRFAHILGSKTIDSLKEIASAEQLLSNALLVDVNYCTLGARYSNVAIAPNLRGHYISANSAPSVSGVEIPATEICIGVKQDRFYARWTRTGQEIEARSNNLLNVTYAPEVIRFLLDIQNYGVPRPSPFDWGIVDSLTVLPRIKYKKTILVPARWRIYSLAATKALDQFEKSLQLFRIEWNVPRFVQLSSSPRDDNALFLDLDSPSDQQLMFKMLKKSQYSNALLYEYVSVDAWHSTSSGKFATEIVANFVRADFVNSKPRKIETLTNKPIQKTDYLRLPGSEWVYVQLDCSHELQEDVIRSAAEMARSLKSSGVLLEWFFLRYFDRFPQLRLRFHVNQQLLFDKGLPVICDWATKLVQTACSKSFSIQSYDREVERYGGQAAMNHIEQIFCMDSELVSDIFALTPSLREANKMILAILTIDNLLNSFQISVEDKACWLKPILGTVDRTLLSDSYREHKNLLHLLLRRDNSSGTLEPYQSLFPLVDRCRHRLMPVTTQILELERTGVLTKPLEAVCQSLIHVHCVRLFGLDRQSENMARSMLFKALQSSLKRQ